MNPASIYAAALGVFLVALAYARPAWAQDKGGYRDSFRTWDKVQHFAIAAGLAFSASTFLHVDPYLSALLTTLAGVGFEVVEGWISWRDVVCDAAGAVLGAALASQLL